MSDTYFQFMVTIALMVDTAYLIVYGTQTRWWLDWIGWALMTKAVGLAVLLGFTAAFWIFGPDYPYRDEIRNTGITVVTIGLALALAAMVRALFQRRPNQQP